MNKDKEYSSDTDPAVSAAYREIATETPPPRLDDIVLREAKEETKPGISFSNFFRSVRRPLAFAATLVLALSLVLQFENELTGTATYPTGGTSRPSDANTNADEISAVIDASAEHIEAQAKQGEQVMSQGLLNQPMPDSPAATKSGSADRARSCTGEQLASAELWWVCITDLEGGGHYDDATHERELLTNTYPDFLPAE